MIIFDTGVLLAYLEKEDPDHARAAALVDQLAEDDWGVTTFTMAELLAGPASLGEDWLGVATRILRNLGVEEQPWPNGAATRLAVLRAETGLVMPACATLLLAESEGAAIATFDVDLAAAAWRRNITVVGR